MITNELRDEGSRPRLAFICPSFGAASEVWMYRQATQMQLFDVRVLARQRENADLYPAGNVIVETVDVPIRPPRWRVVRYPYYLLNAEYGFFRGTRAEALWWTDRIRKHQPAVHFCQYGSIALHLFPILRKSAVPIVIQFNGYDLSRSVRNWRYRRRLISARKNVAGCVVVAEYQREWLLQHGFARSQITKIPYGAPIGDLPVAERVGDGDCRFVAVGRLVDKKRPDLTIRAFAQCAQQVPGVSLRIIGDGPLRPECEQIPEQLGVGDRVQFLGSQSIDRVKEELANACVYVQHSVTASDGDKEGWPVSIAEAAAAGLPVISTQHASIPEQVEHGVTGLLCDELDWPTMAQHMTELASDPRRRAVMGRAAREKMMQFDTANQIARLEEFLLAQVGKQ